ncbi:MAG: dicarboxylate/amino acid:cation symporter [Tissierellia bacterium]|nr:dicarboxylate/amino acid:cation symporter [Tissierellia bacterium]
MLFKKKISLTVQIIIAMVIGLILGLMFKENIAPIKVVGDIFIRLIQMSIALLIMSAVIDSLGNTDGEKIGKLGTRLFFYFTLGTIIAAAFGILAGNILPAGSINVEASVDSFEAKEASWIEMILDFFPTNIIESLASGNMINIIIFSILFGLTLNKMKQKNIHAAEVILDITKSIYESLTFMIGKIMLLAPIGIAALFAAATGISGAKILIPLIGFLIIFGVASFLYLLVWLFLIGLKLKVSPIKLLKKIMPMTIMALTTTSSAVTLPLKMKDSEEKFGVSKSVSDVVNPLGMVLNSNGLAMFLSIVCVVIGKMYDLELEFSSIIQIVVLSSLACLGTVVVPGGGIVALTIVIPALGFPLEAIGIFAGIDWFSGMFRTMLNVDIDALVSLLIADSFNEVDRNLLQS